MLETAKQYRRSCFTNIILFHIFLPENKSSALHLQSTGEVAAERKRAVDQDGEYDGQAV